MSELFEWVASSPRLSWPMLFVLGVAAGALIGFATGLPVTGQVFAGTAPLTSVIPDRSEVEQSELARAHETATRTGIRSNATPASSLPSNLEQLPTFRLPASTETSSDRPKIALVIDDLGLDRSAFDRVNRLPGSVTMAFLPYGEEASKMMSDVAEDHELMLHLPMEPVADKDSAGPGALMTTSSPDQVMADLLSNLGKLDGYVGVNNHTGSAFTADSERMRLVLAELARRDLFFLDSLTTKDRVAKRIGPSVGARVMERDIFLDGEWPDVSVESVKAQLAKVEQIAKDRGYAIAIAHPYDETLRTIGPWLLTAEARGFDLVPISELMPPSKRKTVLARLR